MELSCPEASGAALRCRAAIYTCPPLQILDGSFGLPRRLADINLPEIDSSEYRRHVVHSPSSFIHLEISFSHILPVSESLFQSEPGLRDQIP